MVGIRKNLIMCGALSILIMITISAIPVDADTDLTYSVEHSGYLNNFEFVAVKNGTLTYSVSSTLHFSVLIVTEDDYNRSQLNEPFAYISALSAVNVTSASYDGHIAPGDYFALIYIIGDGNVSGAIFVHDPVFAVEYPHSSSDMEIPWDVILTASATAIVVCIGTIALMIWRKGAK